MSVENDRRQHNGTAKDRQNDPPRWVYFVLALMAGILIAAGVVVLASERAATHAEDAARSATASLNASRAASDRLESAEFGACRRLQVVRDQANVINATVWLVLRNAVESARPSDRPTFRVLARATAYAAPANCQQAVQHPASYRPPVPVPFSKLPPKFASMLIIAAQHREPAPTPPGGTP
jgi:hypothetical protein